MRVASAYSGAGGMDLGFIEAGFDIVWACDIDRDSVETHEMNIGSPCVCADVEGVLGDVPSVDVVIGGPPCQGFSRAGKMDPDDPRSRHVMTFMRVVERASPRAFVMENVKELATNARFADVMRVLWMLARVQGYEATLHVLDASDYGVPQRRERMFLVGARRPVGVGEGRDVVTVRSALGRLPRVGQPGNDDPCTAVITTARAPVLRRSPYAGLLLNGQGRVLDADAPALTLPASMGGNRTPIVDQGNLDDPEVEPWVERYHAHLVEGGAPGWPVPERLRRVTVQEAAALQGFPASWVFAGGRSSRFRQIGNAVPPPLARAVAEGVRLAID